MAIKFNQFTTGTNADTSASDLLVGYDSTQDGVAGGERKWTISTIANAVSGITKNALSDDMYSGGSLGFRNKIFNGAMRIDQRNAGSPSIWNSTAAAAISGFAVDRFRSSAISGNTWGTAVLSAQRSTDAPDEFDTSLKLTVNTADTSLAATDVYAFVQPIEGNNISDLGFGTASAKPITISFWVKSSIAGTYCVSFSNNAQNRSLVDTYTVNAANTWEYKFVTINADTTGTWLTDANAGLFVRWDLGSGSNLQTATTNTWQGTLYTRTSGSVNWVSTVGATFFITGVQVEKGNVATPFEHRPIGMELFLARRYYFQAAGGSLLARSIPIWNPMPTVWSQYTHTITYQTDVTMRAVAAIKVKIYKGDTLTLITPNSLGMDSDNRTISMGIADTSTGFCDLREVKASAEL